MVLVSLSHFTNLEPDLLTLAVFLAVFIGSHG